MKFYKSAHSLEVKVIKTTVLVILLLVILNLFLIASLDISTVLKVALIVIISALTFYFYANSLREVCFKDNLLILKRKFGNRSFEIANITSISAVEFSKLTSTISFKGFLGFN